MSERLPMPDSAQYRGERESLPVDLRPAFDALVESYRFHAFVIYEKPFVSYRVLAALVRDGWRAGSASTKPGASL